MYYAFILFQDSIKEVTEASESARDTVIGMIDGFWQRLPYLAVGIVVFLAFWLISSLARRLIRAAVTKAGFNEMIASLIARMCNIIIIAVGFFVAAAVVIPGLTAGDLMAGLGIGSVALGFAFKDVLQNLFAGFLILLYQPFKIGDQIKIDDFEGTVEDITIRATNIKTYDGERVVIPNSQLYMNAVLVRTAYPQRRTQFVVGIGYEDDIEEARETLFDVLSETKGILESPGASVDVIELADSSVNLKVQFWTESTQSSVRKATDGLVTKIKYALDKKGIEIPYPTHVVFSKSG